MWITSWSDEDARLALEAATQMAERWGEDMAIMSDLSVRPLKDAETTPLEIVRCPAAFRKNANRR